jgi:hypothetical protein
MQSIFTPFSPQYHKEKKMLPYCPYCNKNMPFKTLLNASAESTCPHCHKPIKARLSVLRVVLFFSVLYFVFRFIGDLYFGLNSTLSSGLLGGVVGVITLFLSYKFEKRDLDQ